MIQDADKFAVRRLQQTDDLRERILDGADDLAARRVPRLLHA